MRFGLLPDEGGHWLLVQHLGVAGTMDFLMRKRIVSADEALTRWVQLLQSQASELVTAQEVAGDAARVQASFLS